MTNRRDGNDQRLVAKLRVGVLAAVCVMFPGISIAQGLDIRNNEDRRTVIESTAGNHAAYTLAGTVLPFPFDKGPELSAYGLNIFLKFIPPVLEAPPRVVVRPNFGECEFRYTRAEHLRGSTSVFAGDPNALFDYENIFGLSVPAIPEDWGLLDDGGEFPGPNGQIVYGDYDPEIWHYNTGAYVSITRLETITDDEGTYQAGRYLFSEALNRDDYLVGNFAIRGTEIFEIGNNFLTWSAENKLDWIFDVAFTPLLFAMEAKIAMKAATPSTRIATKGARPWSQKALAATRKLPAAMKKQMIKIAGKQATKRGLAFVADSVFENPDINITAWPTGVVSTSRQTIAVLDEVPPTIRAIGQPAPFEANSPGGELAIQHHPTLRALMEVSDNCGREVNLDPEPSGTDFWPVGQTTQIQWCGRDLGPNADGGVFRRCADFNIQVVDTRPPVIFTPPSRTIIASSPQSIDIGRAGAFDVADLDTSITSNAPSLFPVGRTAVTWTATDSSQNTSTGTQWVSVKASNAAPTAEDQFVGNVTSFEPTRIELFATDPDPALDGRFDQLSFRIDERPDHGFFIAPLFPYFIDDHRAHQINPDGSYSSYVADAQSACVDDNRDITSPGMITRPFMVDVRDDGTTYVMDDVYRCDTSAAVNPFSADERRIARFITDDNGVMQFHSEYSLGSNRPPPESQQLAFDNDENAYFIRGDNIIVVDQNMVEIRRISIARLTRFSGGRLVRAYPSSGNGMLATIAISPNQILYTTNGYEIFAYDLTRTVAEAGVAEAGEDPNNLRRLRAYAFRPTDPTFRDEEPFLSWGSFTTQDGFTDLEVDSEGNLYASSESTARVYKWQGETFLPDRSLGDPPAFIGWMGACDANLDANVQACDVANGRSFGFACQDDLCGPNLQEGVTGILLGNDPGQFWTVRGIDVSPRDELYVVDAGANNRIQRFTSEGFFAGEARSTCGGSCFILGDFGVVTHISVNSHSLYVLDPDQELTHVFETTPITDIDDQTLQQRQQAFVLYQSENNYIGPDTFSFFANDGLADSNRARIDLDVIRNYRPPVAARGIEVFGREDEALEIPLAGSDPDGDTVAFRVTVPPENGSIERVGEEWRYTPNSDFYGQDSFEFVASDAPTSVPAQDSTPATVMINIQPVNDAPQISFEALEGVPIGYPLDVVVRLADVDAADSHRIAIDWGDGVFESPTLGMSIPGEGTGFDLGQAAEVILTHTYLRTGFGLPSRTITICASDAPTTAPLISCNDSGVNARIRTTVTPQTMVDLVVSGRDSQPGLTDQDTTQSLQALSARGNTDPTAMLTFPEPVLDGDAVTYTFTTLNSPPSSGGQGIATSVALEIAVPDELTVDTFGSDDGEVTCTIDTDDKLITCLRDSLSPNQQFDVSVQARGTGRLLEDAVVNLVASVTADQEDPTVSSGAAILTTLLYDGDNDADGDGIPNSADAFPGDPTESRDSDADGIGNNADPDDDNDGLPDYWEARLNLDSLDSADANRDSDADGLTNLEEFAAGTRPDIADSDRDGIADNADNCALAFNRNQFDVTANGLGDLCDASAFASVVALNDIDGDDIPDYALITTQDGVTEAFIKNGDTDLSIGGDRLNLGDPATSTVITTLGLANTGGADEVAIATLNQDIDGAIAVRAWGPSTGNALFNQLFFDSLPNGYEAVDMAYINTPQEPSIAVAVYHPETRSALLEVRLIDNGEVVTRLDYSNDIEILQLLDRNEETLFTVLALNINTGRLELVTRSAVDGSIVWSDEIVDDDWIRFATASFTDKLATMTETTNGVSTVSTWRSDDGTPIASFEVFDTDWRVLDLQAIQLPTDGRDIVAVLASTLDGEIRVELFDATTGTSIRARSFFTASDAPRSLVLSSLPTTNNAELGVLVSNRQGSVLLALETALEGQMPRTLTAESRTPTPPPTTPPTTPPAPPPSNGGGGGGAAGWLFLVMTGICVFARQQVQLRRRESNRHMRGSNDGPRLAVFTRYYSPRSSFCRRA